MYSDPIEPESSITNRMFGGIDPVPVCNGKFGNGAACPDAPMSPAISPTKGASTRLRPRNCERFIERTSWNFVKGLENNGRAVIRLASDNDTEDLAVGTARGG